jgi:hypothetical protein
MRRPVAAETKLHSATKASALDFSERLDCYMRCALAQVDHQHPGPGGERNDILSTGRQAVSPPYKDRQPQSTILISIITMRAIRIRFSEWLEQRKSK